MGFSPLSLQNMGERLIPQHQLWAFLLALWGKKASSEIETKKEGCSQIQEEL